MSTQQYRMSKRTLIRTIVGILAATATTCETVACGSTHHKELPLSAYTVRGGEQPGFHQSARPSYAATAAQFDSGDPDAANQNREFARNGFQRAITVHTATTVGAQGISSVIQLSSATNATSEQGILAAHTRAMMSSAGAAPTRFRVPGVPRAVGLADPQAANVLVAEGRCIMIVGDEGPSDPRPSAAAATRAIYVRTHSRAGVC